MLHPMQPSSPSPREYLARAAQAERQGTWISRIAAREWRALAADACRQLAKETAR